MRTYGHNSQINNLARKNELIEYIIQKNIKESIYASCYSVPENLAGNEPQEWKVKSIDSSNN